MSTALSRGHQRGELLEEVLDKDDLVAHRIIAQSVAGVDLNHQEALVVRLPAADRQSQC